MGGDDGPGSAEVVVVVVSDGAERVVGRLVGVAVDLALVDALARLQLHARRCGCSVRLGRPSPALRELLQLVGLAELVGGTGDGAGEP